MVKPINITCLLALTLIGFSFPIQALCESTEKTLVENTSTQAPVSQPPASHGMTQQEISYLWKQIITGKHRAEGHRSRDVFRHPRETLEFFEVTPDMWVAEIWPGGKGWYTEILAPFLRSKGRLYAAHFHPAAHREFYRKSYQSFISKLDKYPETYVNMRITTLQPPEHVDIAPPESLDRVLTFRNVHNWIKIGAEDKVFKAFYQALKPGGILGVVEHRGKPGISRKDMMVSGYVPEAFVIDIANKAGFELLEKSEINANPKDTTDHPKGVWTLLPALRLGEDSREKYETIGESDRMTLKFKKPM